MNLKIDSNSDLGLLKKHDISSLIVSENSFAPKTRNIVDKVEIVPPEMMFMDAYEGKEFCKRLTLRNVGSRTAFVRIGAPTAKIFRLKPMERICRLPAGLSLSRLIRMKYSRVFAIHGAQIPIFINNSNIQYPLIIFLNQAKIVVEPTEVNFGSIDAVSSVVSKTVVVRNEGSKSTSFCIDLGRNELELIVEPTRGILEASGYVNLKVEVMGFYEGPFKKEFWLKTTPPKRVTVVGEFITPKIIPTYPKEHADFRMITFPRLYLGMSATRTLIIKNISSSHVMFCVKGIHNNNYLIYEEVVKKDEHFKSFQIYPLEGRLKSQETAVIEITFRPIETIYHHAVCFIQVIRINCTDVDDSVIIRAQEEPTPLLRDSERKTSSTLTMASTKHTVQDSELLEGEECSLDNLVTDRKIAEVESFRVCLYGDKEKVKVKVQPEAICLNEIQIYEVLTRELLFENCSSNLPIRIRYLKMAFIDIWPSKIYLKPKETKEVTVKIKSKRAGLYLSDIKFELLAYDIYDYSVEREEILLDHIGVKVSFTAILKTTVPKTKFVTKLSPDNIHEVGFMTHAIQFNSKVEKPKTAILYENRKIFADDDSGLIAFPNDRSNSLRPWTEKKPCKTIFAKIPRIVVSHDEYGYSSMTLLLRKENRKYYIQYLRTKQGNVRLKKQKKNLGFEATRKWMFERYACEAAEKEKEELPSVSTLFPLTPMMLHNVKINPKYIRLQRVAPISNVEHIFKIHNQNPFPIFVYVTSVKLGIHFPQGHYKIVRPQEEKIMTLTCFAGLVGRYINLIQIIVNFSHLYTISVMVEVVPKVINLGDNVLNFEPEKSGNIKFIELQNNLNSSISFSTEISYSRFSIEPPMAVIPQKRSLLCAVRYDNLPEMPDYCELVLTSEGGGAQIMQISRKKEKPKVEIYPSHLNLFNLPLNIKKTYRLRVRNTMNYNICYMIVDPSPLQGVEIFPFQGIINATAELEFVVTVVIDNSESFETNFEFVFEDSFSVFLPIQGTIVIPTVDIRPEYIVNRQLIPFAYRRNIFYVKNESVCDCVVRFELDQYEYFRVTEDETDLDGTIHNTDLKLLPGEVKTLFLHFHPMDALTESFYMPIVINNMVGPPLLTFGESVHFILNNQESGTTTKLPCMKITTICGTPSLNFSALKLTFKYGISDIYNEQLTKFFTAKNGGNDTVEFCIRTDDLLPQFNLDYHSGTAVQYTTCSIICKLLPGESTIFLAKFIPDFPGRFSNNLPIYVRNYLDGCIFNYLRLSGTYEESKITTINDIFYLGCTPIDFRSSVILDLHSKHHKDDCQISFSSPSSDVTITFRERTRKQSRNITKVKFVIMATKPTSIFTNIKFECTCGATCCIKLAAFCDNCFLSHYAFFLNHKDFIEKSLLMPALNFESGKSTENQYLLPQETLRKVRSSSHSMKYTQFSDYPETENVHNFPFLLIKEDENSVDEYTTIMRSTLNFVERWLNSQGFYKTKFFKIPQTISLAPVVKEKDSSKTDYIIEPTILSFLVELAGIQVREASLTTKVTNFTPKNIALHFFNTYSNMLRYLQNKGALLPHVFPEYLLTYEYYEIMHELYSNMLELKEKFDDNKFQAYSAQCYLDVILQSIKIFILSHIRMFDIAMTPLSSHDEGTSEERSFGSSIGTPLSAPTTDVIPNCYIYTTNEQVLLYWLQYHFDNQSNLLWQSHFIGETTKLEPKEIKLFGEILSDSLVFACVTAAYCPYLTSTLTKMFVPPTSSEEYHHNACTVIKAWNSLKLSYLVEPKDIVAPNEVNMFLLTLYLYEILPSFYPEESLTLKAKLTQESRANISLVNRSRHQMLYAVLFFNNDSESFSSVTDVFKLQSGKTGAFEIKYQAKKISSQKAILVLSGELPGKKYGRSRAINLIGVTDLNYSTEHFEFKCDCYKIYRMKLQLFSPYNVPDNYEVFYKIIDAGAENSIQEEMELYSWREYVQGKVPKAMFSKQYEYAIIDPAEGFFFEPIICCRIILVKIFKMFMVGKHGDWCFDIKIVPQISKEIHEVINVSLPRGFNSQVCACRGKSNDIALICPRTIRISIPSKNTLFFKATKEMFIACTDEKFLSFWKKYLPMRTVFNVLKVILFSDKSGMRTSDYSILFEKSRTFNIYTDINSPLTAMKQVTVDDVTAEEGTELIIHVNPGFDQTRDSTILSLESISGIWKRFYKLNFYES